MIMIKNKYKGDDDKIHQECASECHFLFTYYTDIYNKIRKDELDIQIMNKFLDILKQIEDRSEDTRLNSSHITISYAVFCLKKKKKNNNKKKTKKKKHKKKKKKT